jgi:HD-like signal output (HDOD) protein
MVAFLMIVLPAVLLLFVIFYALFHSKGGAAARLPDRPPTRRQAVERPPGREQHPSGDVFDPRLDPASAAPVDPLREGSETRSIRLLDGMDRLFTAEAPPGKAGPPLGIDAVPADVLGGVLAHIASLKNVGILHHLQRLVGDPHSTMAELSRMITSNPILSAKILQIANSPYYGMPQKLNSISHAIMIIGMNNLKTILYHEGVIQVLKEKSFRDNPAMQALWQHLNYTSICASYIQYLFGGLNMGTLFTLGLLHDIGKFIMMKAAPPGQDGQEPAGLYLPDWTLAEEEEHCGINHALVGRLALQHWGLSPLMVEAVSLHHAPAKFPPDALGLDRETLQYLLVLFLADQAAKLFAGADTADLDDIRTDRLHPAYHSLIDRNKLSSLIADKSLLAQLREAEATIGVYA